MSVCQGSRDNGQSIPLLGVTTLMRLQGCTPESGDVLCTVEEVDETEGTREMDVERGGEVEDADGCCGCGCCCWGVVEGFRGVCGVDEEGGGRGEDGVELWLGGFCAEGERG